MLYCKLTASNYKQQDLFSEPHRPEQKVTECKPKVLGDDDIYDTERRSSYEYEGRTIRLPYVD